VRLADPSTLANSDLVRPTIAAALDLQPWLKDIKPINKKHLAILSR
jgi:hypothetical protein